MDILELVYNEDGSMVGREEDDNVLAIWNKHDGSEHAVYVSPAYFQLVTSENTSTYDDIQENAQAMLKVQQPSTSKCSTTTNNVNGGRSLQFMEIGEKNKGHMNMPKNNVQKLNEVFKVQEASTSTCSNDRNSFDREDTFDDVETEKEKEVYVDTGKSNVEKLNEESNHARWTDDMTFLLIENYKNLEKDKKNVTTVKFFKEIAVLMKNKGYNLSGEQCNTKWKLLTSMYKLNLLKKSKTGAKPVTWRFFDTLHEMFHNRPEIQPVAVASSLQGYRQLLNSEIQKENNREPPKKNNIRKPKQTLLLEELTESRKEAKERHEETKEQRNAFLQILRDAVNVMKEKK